MNLGRTVVDHVARFFDALESVAHQIAAQLRRPPLVRPPAPAVKRQHRVYRVRGTGRVLGRFRGRR